MKASRAGGHCSWVGGVPGVGQGGGRVLSVWGGGRSSPKGPGDFGAWGLALCFLHPLVCAAVHSAWPPLHAAVRHWRYDYSSRRPPKRICAPRISGPGGAPPTQTRMQTRHTYVACPMGSSSTAYAPQSNSQTLLLNHKTRCTNQSQACPASRALNLPVPSVLISTCRAGTTTTCYGAALTLLEGVREQRACSPTYHNSVPECRIYSTRPHRAPSCAPVRAIPIPTHSLGRTHRAPPPLRMAVSCTACCSTTPTPPPTGPKDITWQSAIKRHEELQYGK